MLCVGSSIPILAFGRVLQGLSAAAVGIVGLALLADTAGPEHFGQIMGYVSLASNVAGLVAPLLDGVVYAKGGYYAVFAMCFGLIGFDITFRLAIIEKKSAAQWEAILEESRLQSESGRELQASKAVQAASLTETAEMDMHNSTPPMAASPTPFPEPLRKQKKSQFPPWITFLASSRMLTALWGIFVQSLFRTAFDSTLRLFCKRTFGWDSTGAGLIYLAFVLPTFLAPKIDSLADKYGPRRFAACGFLITLPVSSSSDM